jgi:formate dehydrogenase subunit beta
MNGLFPVEHNDTRAAVSALLTKVLQSGMVDALLVPLRNPAGDAVTPALVKNPALLSEADPLAPVLPVNGARLASMLTQHTPHPRLGVVMRSCEIRALVELVKLQQASLEGMTIIGVDCLGTVEVKDYARQISNLKSQISKGADLTFDISNLKFESLRPACEMCEYPAPANADIVIQQIGVDNSAALHVEAKGAWPELLGLTEAQPNGRAGALTELVAQRTAKRDAVFGEMQAQVSSPEKLAAMFSTCIRCHNCMTNCPICYCKTCFFKTNVFDHEPMQFIAWAERKGATRMPADTVLFHLTRMNHMSTSCIGCGLCTSACPVDINVGAAFRTVAAKTQAVFNYVAGKSVDDPIPVKNFEVNELQQLGEH